MLKKLCLLTVLLGSLSMFAVDGTTLINQATVIAAGGFPYKITQPGSYKLTGNLTVPANLDGIDVMSDDVTIDLNGFSITGPLVCQVGAPCTTGAGQEGIRSHARNTTIRNGHVHGFFRGIFLANGLIEEVHASGNSNAGIDAIRSVIRRNNVSNNFGGGIVAQSSVVTENIAADNAGAGFFLSAGGVFGSNMLISATGTDFQLTNVVSQHNNSCTDINGNTTTC